MASTYTALKLNDRGDSVKQLQTALNASGNYGLKVDGVFGAKTQTALKQYQTAQGLTASGVLDEGTWNALNGGSGSPGSPSSGSADDVLGQLQQALANPGYTPKTPEQIRQQAEGEYQSYYDQLRLSAQQQQQQSDLALQQQREGLQDTYDKQREDSAKQYRLAYSQTDRAMLGRGMQRSSYAAQTLANLLQEGAEAQQDIGDQQAAAEGNIDAQRTQLAQQLAAQLGQYDAAQQADILARIRELEDQEYDRSQAQQANQNNLALQIWQALYQGERDKVADQQWQLQFEQSLKSGGGGSSSSGTKDGTTDGTDSKTTPATGFGSFWELANYLGGSVQNLNPLQQAYLQSGLEPLNRTAKKTKMK